MKLLCCKWNCQPSSHMNLGASVSFIVKGNKAQCFSTSPLPCVVTQIRLSPLVAHAHTHTCTPTHAHTHKYTSPPHAPPHLLWRVAIKATWLYVLFKPWSITVGWCHFRSLSAGERPVFHSTTHTHPPTHTKKSITNSHTVIQKFKNHFLTVFLTLCDQFFLVLEGRNYFSFLIVMWKS